MKEFLRRFAQRTAALLRWLMIGLIGDLSWQPPGWLRTLSAKARANRRSVAMAALMILLGAGGGWYAWRWQQRQPKPHFVKVSIDDIGLTPLEKDPVLPRLRVNFSESAARLDLIDKPLPAELIRLEPSWPGRWLWMRDRTLVFTPKKDWSADQPFHVTIDPAALAPHVRLARYDFKTHTPAFGGGFRKTEFYQDPKDPAIKQVVATLQFTHAVDLEELNRHLSVRMLGNTAVFRPADAAHPFTLTAGLRQREFYLRTAPLTLPETEDFMKLILTPGLRGAQGGAPMRGDSQAKVRVPDLYSFFRIASAETKIVRNKDGDPEQFLIIETKGSARSEEIAKALQVYHLPKANPNRSEDHSAKEKEDNDQPADDEDETGDEDDSSKRDGRYHEDGNRDEGAGAEDTKDADQADDFDDWAPKEVDADALAHSKPLKPALIPAKEEYSEVHTFRLRLDSPGHLFVTIRKGVKALGGYTLRDDYTAVAPVPVPEKEIVIQGEGGVLALSGERKLSIKSRGVPAIRYEIARVPADQINHLASQTEGNFQNPEFLSRYFNERDIARITLETQTINLRNPVQPNYSTFDFSSHLLPANGAREGLFFLTVSAWDPRTNKYIREVADRRFILVTNIGLLVKENTDGSRDVFLQSLGSGEPMAGAKVEILARNGASLATAQTGVDGRASLPSLGKNPRDSREPVAIAARKGDDVAFMPFRRNDRKLDFSRFDIDGIEQKTGKELDAFVFTERGVYRPGDEMHIGVMVKQRDWGGSFAGMPLETEVRDARDLAVQVKKLVLPKAGFTEFTYPTAYESPTGYYTINIYLLRDGKRSTLLGTAGAHVKEFLPDRLKIDTRFSKTAPRGWVTPGDMQASVSLQNLYGTPASERRIKARARVNPRNFRFKEFADYTFYDRLNEAKKNWEGETIELGEKQTDATGAAHFDLDLEKFADATYRLTFVAEGFEAEGGRSVEDESAILVSSLPYAVGCRADGNLDYITAGGTGRTAEFVAVDAGLNRIALENLTLRIVDQSFVSVLTKRDNGNYEYESIRRENLLLEQPTAISAEGWKYALPSAVPGNFIMELRDKAGLTVSKVNYSVVGQGKAARSLEKNAELEIKLPRQQYLAGEEIEVAVTAPYVGSGLITIERERVYAHTWFKTTNTSSVQKITIPADFDGTGYINVSFIRALDSKEIFMSPLSYAVTPFTANMERRKLNVQLRAADQSKPGHPLTIHYRTDRPAKIAVFAVDQGILQVTKYQTPDPLGHMFRKAALTVNTAQIVDLILPEFSLLRNAAAAGGDGDVGPLNPFRRVTEKPVVFWSGIVDADSTEREVSYHVPDYFSGTLTLMAVAVAPDAVGSAKSSAIIRNPFTLTTGVPTFAAPGDQFEVGLTMANQLSGSGPEAQINLQAEPSEGLEIVRAPKGALRVPEGREASVVFVVRARDKLGSATLGFRAWMGAEESRVHATLSVRPASPFMTLVRGGNFRKDSAEAPITRTLYPEFRKLEATVSALPLGLAHGLERYLKEYPHGCSEQITSGAFARMALAGEADFGLTRAEAVAQLEKTFATLRRRQNDQGGFGYWSATDKNDGIDFITVYVMHFLSESKAAGFAVPDDMFQAGLRRLRKMAVDSPSGLQDARTQAYALYVLTREGVVTTNYLLNLRDYLDGHYRAEWPRDLAGVYMAGTLSLLKKEDEARKMIGGYRIGKPDLRHRWDFYQPLSADSQYLTILARHFPDRLKAVSAEEFQSIVRPIGEGNFSTLSAAYAVLALKAYSQQVESNPLRLGVGAVTGKPPHETALSLEGGALLRRAKFPAQATALRFHAEGTNTPGAMGVFYQTVEAGFDRALPDKALTDGMEVYRELVDAKGNPVTQVKIGERITVRLKVRSTNLGRVITNAAIIDLLPGGFEVVSDSLQPGSGTVPGMDYTEVREDRAVFFGTVTPTVREIVYQIKPVNRGEFIVPPVYAESMYDRAIRARGLGGKITVTEAK
jgi:uncharacterized protein YfaS (alpha-2-macroglobulin family)